MLGFPRLWLVLIGLRWAGRSPPHIFVYRAGMGWVGLGWAGSPSRWARLGCVGLGGALCTFLYTGLGWAFLGWPELRWAGLRWSLLRWAGLSSAGLG